jgi:hypothetical protein
LLDSNGSGYQGLWSSGYYSGSAYTTSSKWLIYRDAAGDTFMPDATVGTLAVTSTTHFKVQNVNTQYWQYHGTSTQIQFKFNSVANAFNWPDNSVKFHICSNGTSGNGSSRTIKHNIMPLNSIGDKLDKLTPVTFIYNDDPKNTKLAGLIFEDTYPILPEICMGTPTDNPTDVGISYTSLTPFLLKEIQDLRKRIKLLEEER